MNTYRLHIRNTQGEMQATGVSFEAESLKDAKQQARRVTGIDAREWELRKTQDPRRA